MANDGQPTRIETTLDAVSDPLSDSKPTASQAGSTETSYLVARPSESTDESSLVSTAAYGAKDPPLEQLGRYRLEKILGRGGMGVVWLGFDPQLNRRVAIKTVRPDIRFEGDALAMFLEEGRRLASLNHASIIPVYDCGNEQGICYLVSEYVSQGTLADFLQNESLTHQQAADLVARVADAAHYAHLRGLVHRDIKPANILIREGDKPLLADFGLAIAEEEQLREAPGTLGTYAYMAPEQMLGESRFVDGRADIYSLGVVLYQLLTGRLPYLVKTRDEYRELVLHRDPRPPRSVREDIPPDLEAICLKCLARQPAERYTTAADLAAALRKPVAAKAIDKRWLWGTAAAVVLLCGTLVAARWRPEPTPTPKPDDAATAKNNESTPVPPKPTERPETMTSTDRPVLKVSEVKVAAKLSTSWGLRDDGESLWFLSRDLCLFELGNYDGGDLSFSISMEQQDWTGRLGLYWGYRPSLDEPGKYELEYLQLYPRDDHNLRLRDAKLTFPLGRTHLTSDSELAVFDLARLSGYRYQIGFKIRTGELVRFEWDTLDLSKLVAQRAANAGSPQSLEGGFGLINFGTSGTFSGPILNGQALQFGVEESPTSDNP